MKKIRWPSLNRLIGLGGKASVPPEMIVVGLGNPGDRYRDTRHNIGFRCVDRVAGDHAIELSRRQRRALIGEGVKSGPLEVSSGLTEAAIEAAHENRNLVFEIDEDAYFIDPSPPRAALS